MESGTLNPRDGDLQEAARLEQLGDAAASVRDQAIAYYKDAQRLLLPPGAIWTDRELYDRRMELFEQIQQKLYRLDDKVNQGGVSDPLPPITPRAPYSGSRFEAASIALRVGFCSRAGGSRGAALHRL